MANENINIRLTLKDEFTSSMGKVSKTFKNMESDVKRFRRELNQVSSSMIMLGGVITAPFALSLRTASKYSLEAYNVTRQYERSLESLQVSIANSVMPVFKKLADRLSDLVNQFNALDPKIRDNTMQITLWSGVLLIAAGTVGKLAANMLTIGASVLSVGKWITGAFGAGGSVFVGIAGGVLIFAGALLLVVQFWDQLERYVKPVLSVMEAGFSLLVSVVADFTARLAGMASMILNVWGWIAGVAAKIPGPFREAFNDIKGYIDEVKEKVEGFKESAENLSTTALRDAFESIKNGSSVSAGNLEKLHEALLKVEEMIKGFMSGGGGGGTPGTEGKTFFGGFMLGMQQMIDKFADMHAAGLEMAQRTAQVMQSSFSDLFFNVMKGKFDDLGKVFESFADAVMRAIADMMAQMMALQAMQAVLGLFDLKLANAPGPTIVPKHHSGGVIKKYHSGGVADVPAILQEGEGVVSRKGMAVLGTSNLKKLNNGQGAGGGTTIVIAPTIQAWDMQDIYRNKEAIVGIMTESLSRNGALRGAIKRYA